jgi:ABC-type enterochelin transport system permease subunit
MRIFMIYIGRNIFLSPSMSGTFSDCVGLLMSVLSITCSMNLEQELQESNLLFGNIVLGQAEQHFTC